MLKKKQRMMISKQIRKESGIKLPQAARIAKVMLRGKVGVIQAIQNGLEDKCPNLVIEMENNEFKTWEERLSRGNVYVLGPKGIYDLW